MVAFWKRPFVELIRAGTSPGTGAWAALAEQFATALFARNYKDIAEGANLTPSQRLRKMLELGPPLSKT